MTMARISPTQLKMARAALGWGVRELASEAKVSRDTISRLERGETLKERTLDAVRGALQRAGVEFLSANGVRLRGADAEIAKTRRTRERADW